MRRRDCDLELESMKNVVGQDEKIECHLIRHFRHVEDARADLRKHRPLVLDSSSGLIVWVCLLCPHLLRPRPSPPYLGLSNLALFRCQIEISNRAIFEVPSCDWRLFHHLDKVERNLLLKSEPRHLKKEASVSNVSMFRSVGGLVIVPSTLEPITPRHEKNGMRDI